MSNIEDLIIQTKTYGELTSAEKHILAELVTDEASFQQVKLLYQVADRQQQAKKVVPHKNTKASLDELYLKKHSYSQLNWQKTDKNTILFYQQNWVKYAAILLICLGFTGYFLIKPSTFERSLHVAQLAPLKKTTIHEKDKPIKDDSRQLKEAKSEINNSIITLNESKPQLLASTLPINSQKDSINFLAIPIELAEYKRQQSSLDDEMIQDIEKEAEISRIDAQKMQIKVIPLANLLVYTVPAF